MGVVFMASAFLIVILAGIINGSFALFIKFMQRWRFETIWLGYAVIAFLIAPFVIAWAINPTTTVSFASVSTGLKLLIMIGGLCFGVGQVCFAFAINRIGIGLGFLLNIGIGTVFGSLFPLLIQNSDQLFTLFGLLTVLACALIVIGLVLCYYAGHRRAEDQGHAIRMDFKPYVAGVVAGCIAGLFSAGQNIMFALTQPIKDLALQQGYSQLAASLVPWPFFLLFSFIPYAIYMIYRGVKNKSLSLYVSEPKPHYYLYILIMGLFWYGSLALYSQSAQMIGNFGPVVGWPLFMVLIILTSNFWGWFKKEWKGCSQSVMTRLLVGILLFLVAVILLGLSISMKV
jgi:L-rhamnose-H+ transport protein